MIRSVSLSLNRPLIVFVLGFLYISSGIIQAQDASPSVRIAQPEHGALVRADVQVRAQVSDDQAVTSLELYDGTDPVNQTTGPPLPCPSCDVALTWVTTARWTAWDRVDGASSSAPALVVFNGRLYLFVRAAEREVIYFRSMDPQSVWDEWTQLPDGWLTPSAPSVVVFNDRLYLFVRAVEDNSLRYTFMQADGTWSHKWGNLEGVTHHSPSLVVWDNHLYLFVGGADGGIYFRRMDAKERWTNWSEVGGQTPSHPATAVFNNRLYLFVRAVEDNSLRYRSMGADGLWSHWSNIYGQTPLGPAAAVYGDHLYVLVGGMDNALYVKSMGVAENWSRWDRFPSGQTAHTPAAVLFADRFYIWRTQADGTIWTGLAQQGRTADGPHTLVAQAYDAQGQVGVSEPLSLIVDNTPPLVRLTQPQGGTLRGAIAIAADASDANGVARVEFFIDGNLVGSATEPPYRALWNTLSAAEGPHTLWARAFDLAGNVADSLPIAVVVANHEAAFISHNVPADMLAETSYPLSVTMQNTGASTWTRAAGFSLGLVSENVWGITQVDLEAAEQIRPGASKTFTFSVTAPGVGTYHFQWRMRQAGRWFGESSGDVQVRVQALSNDAAFVTQIVPTTMTAGTDYRLSISMQNTGASSWTAARSYRLALLTENVWGRSRVELEPGEQIRPGASKTFTFAVTAPAAGSYQFQWVMLREGVEVFGTPSESIQIQVQPPPDWNGPPRVDALEPDVLTQGISRMRIAGANLDGNLTVRVLRYAGDQRRHPTATLVQATGRTIDVSLQSGERCIDPQNPSCVMGYYDLAVNNGRGETIVSFRVVPEGPWWDEGTPPVPSPGRAYTLSLLGHGFTNVTVSVSSPEDPLNRMHVENVASQQNQITGILTVDSDAPPNTVYILEIRDNEGRTDRAAVCTCPCPRSPWRVTRCEGQAGASQTNQVIEPDRQSGFVSDSDDRSGDSFLLVKADPDSDTVNETNLLENQPPALSLSLQQAFLVRKEGLLKQPPRDGDGAVSGICPPIPLFRKTIFRFQLQRAFSVCDLVRFGTACLRGVAVGGVANVGTFVVSMHFEVEVTVWLRRLGLYCTILDGPWACLRLVAGAEVLGNSGVIVSIDRCCNPWFPRCSAERFDDYSRVGSLDQLGHQNGVCHRVAGERPSGQWPGIVEGQLQQTACCADHVRASGSGTTFPGTRLARRFNFQRQPTAVMTPASTCPGLQIFQPPRDYTFYIGAEPRMPDITAAARIVNVVPDPTPQTNFTWQAETRLQFRNGRWTMASLPTWSGVGGVYSPNFSAIGIRGGVLTLRAEAGVFAQTFGDRTEGVTIKGTNPGAAPIINAINSALGEERYRRTGRQIACRESGYRQFAGPREGGTGFPVESETGALGIFQLIDPPATCEGVWNWRQNITEGLRVLGDKRREARSMHIDERTRLNNERRAMGLPPCPPGIPTALDPNVDEGGVDQVERETIRRYNCGREHRWEPRDAPNCEGSWVIRPYLPVPRCSQYGDPNFVENVINCQ